MDFAHACMPSIQDYFEDKKLQVPQSWDEFLYLARTNNGSDFNGDGQGDYSLCMQVRLPLCCRWLSLLLCDLTEKAT